MNTHGMQSTKKAAMVKQNVETTARLRIRKAMESIGERLKAERVQVALLISDQEASIMIQGRVKQGRIGDLANGVLNLATTMVNETATPAAS